MPTQYPFDMSSFNGQRMQLATNNPALNAVKQAPANLSSVTPQWSEQEMDNWLRGGAENIAEAAKKLGLNSDMYLKIGYASPDKALEMLAAEAEKVSAAEAEKYVGEQLGALKAPEAEYDPNTGLMKEGYGKKMLEHQNMLSGRIDQGIASAQSKFVKAAWEGRKQKAVAAKDEWRKTNATNSTMSNLQKQAKYYMSQSGVNPMKIAAESAGMKRSLDHAKQLMIEIEKGTDNPFLAFNSPIEIAAQDQKGWVGTLAKSILFRLRAATDETSPTYFEQAKDMLASAAKSFGSLVGWTGKNDTPVNTTKSITGNKAEIEKGLAEWQASLPQTLKGNILDVNHLLRQSLMEGVFNYVVEKTGAASSEQEQQRYLASFGYGEGAGRLLESTNNMMKERNARIEETKNNVIEALIAEYGWRAQTDPEVAAMLQDQINMIRGLPTGYEVDQELIDMVKGREENAIGTGNVDDPAKQDPPPPPPGQTTQSPLLPALEKMFSGLNEDVRKGAKKVLTPQLVEKIRDPKNYEYIKNMYPYVLELLPK